MIKQIYVCECDICGAVEKAKAVNAYRNDTDYQMPNDWTHGKNSEICICPTCSAKLSGSKTYPIIAGDPISVVYGCPTVVLDKVWEDSAKHGSVNLEDYDNH
jgi:hypothetical protein